MNTLRCRVAGHVLAVEFYDEHNDASLLPSFEPFKLAEDDKEEPTLVVSVRDDFDFETMGQEVGQFDCGGCNHGVYMLEDGSYQFVVSDVNGKVCSRMQSTPDFSHCTAALLGDNFRERNYGLNNIMMLAFSFSNATKGTLLVHASVIRKDGYGYLMTAPSGTGKSTHTHLWFKHIPGCDLMNDDNPVVRVLENGEAVIYGSPWSGKTPCYRNIQAPIGAFVRIQQRPKNEIRQMSPIEAFTTLLPAVSSMKWDKRVYTSICQTISRLIGSVKVFELGCLPDAEAAYVCYDAVKAVPSSIPMTYDIPSESEATVPCRNPWAQPKSKKQN